MKTASLIKYYFGPQYAFAGKVPEHIEKAMYNGCLPWPEVLDLIKTALPLEASAKKAPSESGDGNYDEYDVAVGHNPHRDADHFGWTPEDAAEGC